MTPFFGRKKEPKEVYDENMKKANALWESPRLWNSSEYKKLLKHIEKAQEIVEAVEVEQDDIVRLWSMKGSVYNMGYHRLDEALECYDKALSINPREPQTLLNRLFLLHKMDLQGKEVWDEIIRDSDEVLKLLRQELDRKFISRIPDVETWDQMESIINQRHTRAWCSKGISLNKLDKPKEAMNCFDRAVKINPRDFKSWVNRGHACMHLGKPEEAIKCYDKALEIFPRFVLAWYCKGVALNSLGKSGEAKECFRKAAEIDPGFRDKIKSLFG